MEWSLKKKTMKVGLGLTRCDWVGLGLTGLVLAAIASVGADWAKLAHIGKLFGGQTAPAGSGPRSPAAASAASGLMLSAYILGIR
jgi:hypothetical protein